MICLSNGHRIDYVIPSGILGFDGKGGPLKRFFHHIGWIKPELFTIVLKTLTEKPEKGNKVWYNPFRTVRLIPNGMVNAVGLSGPGLDKWCQEYAPNIDWSQSIIGSIYAEDLEAFARMAEKLNQFPLKALEINSCCPNIKSEVTQNISFTVEACQKVYEVSKHPLILKISAGQRYCKEIVRQISEIIEAIAINSVPWEIVFPGKKSPLAKFGNGAVSGGAAQAVNWRIVREIAPLTTAGIIAPDIYWEGDIEKARKLGAKSVSCGAGLSRHPLRISRMIQQDLEKK